jgi:hypothetical protein
MVLESILMKWRDIELEDLLEYILDEDLEGQKAQRGEFIKNKFGNQWRGLHGFAENEFDKFLDKLGEVDPSPKGIYMPWLARLAITKPNENRAEDLDRVGNDLRAFEANKARIANKDINSYKSFNDLFRVIAPFLAPREKTKDELSKEDAAAELAKVKDQIITVYAGSEGWIRIPTTQAAATYMGKGTRWCTSAQKNNMFDHYNKSDNLFVVFDKAQSNRYKEFVNEPANKEKLAPDKGIYQLHINSGQFASDDDSNKGLAAVPAWAGKKILDYYQKNNPSLTFKQLSALQGFTDVNLAKGTDHEGLFDLFKQYDVK